MAFILFYNFFEANATASPAIFYVNLAISEMESGESRCQPISCFFEKDGDFMPTQQKCVLGVTFSDELRDTAPHRHNTYQMICVTRGALELRVATRTYAVQAPSIIFISSLEPHGIRIIGSVYERYTLLIDPVPAHALIKNPALLSAFSNRPEGFRHVVDIAPIADRVVFLLQMLREEHDRAPVLFPENETLLLRTLLITLCRFAPDQLFCAYAGISAIVWEIKQQMEQNVQQEVQLGELAEKYHLSLYYLAHSFKRITGYSIKQYQLFCRLSVARELLAETDLSVTQVALRSGFQDMSNFSRYFRRVLNCSPTDYRRVQRESAEAPEE